MLKLLGLEQTRQDNKKPTKRDGMNDESMICIHKNIKTHVVVLIYFGCCNNVKIKEKSKVFVPFWFCAYKYDF